MSNDSAQKRKKKRRKNMDKQNSTAAKESQATLLH